MLAILLVFYIALTTSSQHVSFHALDAFSAFLTRPLGPLNSDISMAREKKVTDSEAPKKSEHYWQLNYEREKNS